MENYRLPVEELNKKLTEAGLLVDNKPISFSQFKKLARADDYVSYAGRRIKKYIIYFSCGDREWIGFYPPMTTKNESLNISYDYLKDATQNYIDENICWGNRGIPISYGKLRATMPC